MPKPHRLDHDDCLRVAQRHRAELTEDEIRALNIVAGAYACDQDVTDDQLDRARAIYIRFDR